MDERHVEFSVTVGDDSGERESTRLQRRDTPHHLKNKRVTPPPGSAAAADPQGPHVDEAQTTAVDAAEDRVRRILARQIVKLCESFDSESSDQNEAAEVSQGHRRITSMTLRRQSSSLSSSSAYPRGVVGAGAPWCETNFSGVIYSGKL